MKTCNQCQAALWIEHNGYGFCVRPECPNYALLQIPVEDMSGEPGGEVSGDEK
jgi:hypothetical protein